MHLIYCDESCHLENDGHDIMVLGGIVCPETYKRQSYEDIRNIKKKHGISSWFEVKWTKVSKSKVDFYADLVDYFFKCEYLSFRGVLATHKSKLNHVKYNNGNYDDWYYKMYFRLLDPLIDANNEYRIFIDIKDTKGGPKVRKLHEVLCNNIYDFNRDVIRDIKQINSVESELMQLTDLFIGALSYFHRQPWSNQGKIDLINTLINKHDVDLSRKTSLDKMKFNILIWKPRRD